MSGPGARLIVKPEDVVFEQLSWDKTGSKSFFNAVYTDAGTEFGLCVRTDDVVTQFGLDYVQWHNKRPQRGCALEDSATRASMTVEVPETSALYGFFTGLEARFAEVLASRPELRDMVAKLQGVQPRTPQWDTLVTNPAKHAIHQPIMSISDEGWTPQFHLDFDKCKDETGKITLKTRFEEQDADGKWVPIDTECLIAGIPPFTVVRMVLSYVGIRLVPTTGDLRHVFKPSLVAVVRRVADRDEAVAGGLMQSPSADVPYNISFGMLESGTTVFESASKRTRTE